MTSHSLLAQIRGDGEVRDLLAGPFDFDVVVRDAATGWYPIDPERSAEVVARDGSGGLFILYGDDGMLLHVTSEGQAGVIAANLREGVQLIVEYPYWHDLLHFSGGGKPEEMRRDAPLLEQKLIRSQPTINEHRLVIQERLGLVSRSDAIGALYHCVFELSRLVSVSDPHDGTPFGSLFNEFTIASNPFWHTRLR